MQISKPKAIIYVDGYNWYHAIFKHFPEWKWLNIQSFFEALRPDDDVVSVKIFSALVDPDNEASDARMRQKRYFDAIRTLPKVQLILGVFQSREVTCRANGCSYSYHEEKKTDTNIAVAMMSDAFGMKCQRMYVISGDSDIQPPIEWITKNAPSIKTVVYIPALKRDQPNRRLDYYRLKGLPVDCKFLPIENLDEHQLRPVLQLGNGNCAVRPTSWSAPK